MFIYIFFAYVQYISVLISGIRNQEAVSLSLKPTPMCRVTVQLIYIKLSSFKCY